MRAGRMRQPIRFQSRISIREANGETNTDWVDKYSCFADIQQVSGGETLAGEQIVSNAGYRVVTRWWRGITTSDRIIFDRNDGTGERILEIVNVFNAEERNSVMELLCKEAQ